MSTGKSAPTGKPSRDVHQSDLVALVETAVDRALNARERPFIGDREYLPQWVGSNIHSWGDGSFRMWRCADVYRIMGVGCFKLQGRPHCTLGSMPSL